MRLCERCKSYRVEPGDLFCRRCDWNTDVGCWLGILALVVFLAIAISGAK